MIDGTDYIIHVTIDGRWAVRRLYARRARKLLDTRPDARQYARQHVRGPARVWVMTRAGTPDYVFTVARKTGP